jgi:hypothetical protein
MSTAQVLYLQHLITTKLHRDQNFPRKILAHQNLQFRLQPLLLEADNKISGSQGALCQAIEETTTWLESENKGKMRDFEQKISMQWNSERLARLKLADEPAQTHRL